MTSEPVQLHIAFHFHHAAPSNSWAAAAWNCRTQLHARWQLAEGEEMMSIFFPPAPAITAVKKVGVSWWRGDKSFSRPTNRSSRLTIAKDRKVAKGGYGAERWTKSTPVQRSTLRFERLLRLNIIHSPGMCFICPRKVGLIRHNRRLS